MKTNLKHFLALMAVVAIGTVAARAAALTSGSAIAISLEAEPVGATIVTTVSVPFTSLTFGGRLVSTVWADDVSNPFGGLTFTYQLFKNGPDTLERLTLSSYAGFLKTPTSMKIANEMNDFHHIPCETAPGKICNKKYLTMTHISALLIIKSAAKTLQLQTKTLQTYAKP